MSTRRGAPYNDQVRDHGRTLVYEGQDIPKIKGGPDPKKIDQPERTPKGALAQNQLFYGAALRFKHGECEAEIVEVYEKIHRGIWAYNGLFKLVDAWREQSGPRKVFKFKLELLDKTPRSEGASPLRVDQTRLIPTSIKLAVWKRDKGRCVYPGYGARDNLHFDHIIPYSKGGSSLVAENIQLLCTRHNLEKRDKIE